MPALLQHLGAIGQGVQCCPHCRPTLQHRRQPVMQLSRAKLGKQRREWLVWFGYRLAQGGIHALMKQQERIRFIQHPETRVQPGLGGVAAQQCGTEAMDGADAGSLHCHPPRLPIGALGAWGSTGTLLHRCADAVPHFAGSLLGEGDSQDTLGAARRLVWCCRTLVDALHQQAHVALHQHTGLAAAGPGGHYQVAGECDSIVLCGSKGHGYVSLCYSACRIIASKSVVPSRCSSASTCSSAGR
jgi:hypothetical protein